MTHARIPDFSQPAPVRRPAVASTPAPAVPAAPIERPRSAPAVIVADRPDTAHVRAFRFLAVTGEALTAALIIAGGVFAYGYLPFA